MTEHSWSRRCSTETVFSIQGHETDVVRDTSDTDAGSDNELGLEYEPATEDEDKADQPLSNTDSSGQSDTEEIIKTKVIEVTVRDDGDSLADSEQTASESDSEIELHDYWQCARCRARNNNPLYRYCEKCFKVRKNFFPPRPKRKRRCVESVSASETIPRTLSQDSGVETQLSQCDSVSLGSQGSQSSTMVMVLGEEPTRTGGRRKRRSKSFSRSAKRARLSSESDSGPDCDPQVVPITKSVSDPAIVIDQTLQISKKELSESLKEVVDKDSLCIMCLTETKSGVFVHGRVAHICCCYRCAVRVWTTTKRCPVCNCRVSNVLRAVVM